MIKKICITNYYDVDCFRYSEEGNLVPTENPYQQNIPDTKKDDQNCYLTLTEFCELSGRARQTVYNDIQKGRLILGVHYFKPNGGQLIFKKSTIIGWIEKGGTKRSNKNSEYEKDHRTTVVETAPRPRTKSKINI